MDGPAPLTRLTRGGARLAQDRRPRYRLHASSPRSWGGWLRRRSGGEEFVRRGRRYSYAGEIDDALANGDGTRLPPGGNFSAPVAREFREGAKVYLSPVADLGYHRRPRPRRNESFSSAGGCAREAPVHRNGPGVEAPASPPDVQEGRQSGQCRWRGTEEIRQGLVRGPGRRVRAELRPLDGWYHRQAGSSGRHKTAGGRGSGWRCSRSKKTSAPPAPTLRSTNPRSLGAWRCSINTPSRTNSWCGQVATASSGAPARRRLSRCPLRSSRNTFDVLQLEAPVLCCLRVLLTIHG